MSPSILPAASRDAKPSGSAAPTFADFLREETEIDRSTADVASGIGAERKAATEPAGARTGAAEADAPARPDDDGADAPPRAEGPRDTDAQAPASEPALTPPEGLAILAPPPPVAAEQDATPVGPGSTPAPVAPVAAAGPPAIPDAQRLRQEALLAKRRGPGPHPRLPHDRTFLHVETDGPFEAREKRRFGEPADPATGGPEAPAAPGPSSAPPSPPAADPAGAGVPPAAPAPAALPVLEASHPAARDASDAGVPGSAIPIEPREPVPARTAPATSAEPGATVAPAPAPAAGPSAPIADAPRSEAAVDAASAGRFDRLLEQLHGELRAGKNEFRLRLDPPDLGRLDVRIVSHGQGVVVHMVAEKHDVAQWLRTDLPSLHRSVEKDGLQVVHVDVRSWLDLDARGHEGHREAQRPFDDQQLAAPRGLKPRAAPAPIGRPGPMRAATGIDLII